MARTLGQIVAGEVASGEGRGGDLTISGFAATTRSGPMGVRQGRRAARICSWAYFAGAVEREIASVPRRRGRAEVVEMVMAAGCAVGLHRNLGLARKEKYTKSVIDAKPGNTPEDLEAGERVEGWDVMGDSGGREDMGCFICSTARPGRDVSKQTWRGPWKRRRTSGRAMRREVEQNRAKPEPPAREGQRKFCDAA